MPASYRQLDHTSDIRVELRATDFAGLLRVAARCLFETMLERQPVTATRRENVTISSPDRAELLLDWLRELLYLFAARGFAVGAVKRLSVAADGTRLEALLEGEDYSTARHGLRVEVKTPTYHQYVVEEANEGWRAEVVLDV